MDERMPHNFQLISRSTPLPGFKLLCWAHWAINSGGASAGASDIKEAVVTAIINKRAGGTGLISGRKAFQRSFKDGVHLPTLSRCIS
jgi:DhnA family fructose-bisphosphate aldolase class Ia